METNTIAKRANRFISVLVSLPALLAFILFLWIPIIFTFILSFYNWDILSPAQFIGLNNYANLFSDPLFGKYLWNTLFLGIGNMLCFFLIPYLFYISLRKINPMLIRKLTSWYFIPIAIAIIPVALFGIWRIMLNPDFGLINYLLSKLGIAGPDWMATEFWAKPAYLLYSFCQFMPVGIGIALILYGIYQRGSKNNEPSVSKASFQIITIVFFVITLINAIEVFPARNIMSSGGPAGATTSIISYIYTNSYQWFKLGYAAAISNLILIINLILGIIVWRMTEKKSVKLILIDDIIENNLEKKSSKLNILLMIIAGIPIILSLGVLFWAFLIALNQTDEIFRTPMQIIPTGFNWQNYSNALTTFPLGKLYLNSIIYTLGILILQIPITFLAAYSISILKVPGRKLIFFLITATMFVPLGLISIPYFIIGRKLHLFNNPMLLINPQICWGFAVYILKLYFDGLYNKVSEARTSGYSEKAIFQKIVLPSSWPIIAGITALSIYLSWGEYLWSLVSTDRIDSATISQGLLMLQGLHSTEWNLVMAGTILAVIPSAIVFFFILLWLKRILINRLAIISEKR